MHIFLERAERVISAVYGPEHARPRTIFRDERLAPLRAHEHEIVFPRGTRHTDLDRPAAASTRPRTGNDRVTFHFAHTVVTRGFKATESHVARRHRARRSGGLNAERFSQYIEREGAGPGEYGEPLVVSNIDQDRTERIRFWNLLEQYTRTGGRTQQRIIAELPHELGPDDHKAIVEKMVGFFTERGLPATGAVHKPDPQGDQRNVHAHIVYNARPCKRLPDGTWDFCDVKNRPNILEEVRSRHWIPRLRVQWADACNERLLDLPEKRRLYTPHSFKKLGIDKLPTGHLGPHASALERQGVATKQGTINARREHEYQARLIERAHQDRLAKVAEHRAKLEGRKASLHPETVITILNLAGYLEHSANRLRQLDSAELVTDRCLRRPRTAASFYRASLADPNLRPELALRYRERLAEAEKLHDRTTAALFADKIRHGSKARYLRRARLRGEITGAVTGARRRR